MIAMNGAHLAMLLLLFLAISPTLGFFSVSGFFTLFILLMFFFVFLYLRKQPLIGKEAADSGSILVLVYSAIYYGGLYQPPFLKILGQIVFFIMIIYITLAKFIYKRRILPGVAVFFFLVLGLWTIVTSPNPHVDTIVVLKEAPLMLLKGINPYAAEFSRVYAGIKPDYFNYLPFSAVFFIPVVLLFRDPRYIILITNTLAFLLLYRLRDKNRRDSDSVLPLSLLLFLPGTFYMIEHIYLDQVVFFFFVLAAYAVTRSRNLGAFVLSLFFSFKQNLVIALPFFLKSAFLKNRKQLLMFFPFLLILAFFLWNPGAFLNDTVFGLQPGKITSPIDRSMTLPSFINYLFGVPGKAKGIVYLASSLIFAAVYVAVAFRRGMSISQKIIMTTFASYFFSYHAFFNSYFLVGLFLVYDYFKEGFTSSESRKLLP